MKKIARYLFGLAIVYILNLCSENDEFNPELFNKIKGSWQIEYYYKSSTITYHSSDSADLDYPYPVIMNFNNDGGSNIEYSDGQVSNYLTWTTKNNSLILTYWGLDGPGVEWSGEMIKLTEVELHARLTKNVNSPDRILEFELRR